MGLRILLALAISMAFCPGRAFAERPPQARADADVVLVGVVEAVSEPWDLETDYYRVLVRVTAVERRGGVAPGDPFEVTCFQWSRSWPGYNGAVGHSGVPAVGDQGKIYAFGRGGVLTGCYPDWFDVLVPSTRGSWARQWDSRKFRVATYAVLILALLVLGAKRSFRRFVLGAWGRARSKILGFSPLG